MATSGNLRLEIIEARLTRDTEFFSKMDPFVIIETRQQKHRTTTKQGAGKTPRWNEGFDIDVKYIGDDMTIKVMDEDVTSADEVGVSTVKLSAFCAGNGVDEWFPIQHKGKQAGQVHIKSTWRPGQHGGNKAHGHAVGQANQMTAQMGYGMQYNAAPMAQMQAAAAYNQQQQMMQMQQAQIYQQQQQMMMMQQQNQQQQHMMANQQHAMGHQNMMGQQQPMMMGQQQPMMGQQQPMMQQQPQMQQQPMMQQPQMQQPQMQQPQQQYGAPQGQMPQQQQYGAPQGQMPQQQYGQMPPQGQMPQQQYGQMPPQGYR